MMNPQNGKGSKRIPAKVSHKTFSDNYDRIFENTRKRREEENKNKKD